MSGAFPKVIYEEYYIIAHTYMYKYKYIHIHTSVFALLINLLRTERLNRTHSNRNHVVNLFSFHFRVLT